MFSLASKPVPAHMSMHGPQSSVTKRKPRSDAQCNLLKAIPTFHTTGIYLRG